MNLLDRLAYDSGGYTVQEILSSFTKKILEIIDLVNKNEEVCDEAHTLIENIRNEVVPDLVNDIIKEMQDNDYFDDLVNVTLIENLRTDLTTLLNDTITDFTTRLDNFDSQLEHNTKQMISKRVENVFGNNKCILHRGACTVAPEQTSASFQLAKKLGVKVVELDVWKTADNDFVVFHDSTLDDKTNGVGKVEDKTLTELKTLSFTKGANLNKYPNLKILSFNECMKLLKELGLNALIDFKTYTLDSSVYAKLLNIIKANGMLNNVAIATWYGSQIKVIRDLEKSICLGIEQVENESEWDYILNNNIDFAFLTKGTHLTEENIKRLHENYRYCIGFSVNTLDDIKKYIDYGCDYFVTNNIFEGGN